MPASSAVKFTESQVLKPYEVKDPLGIRPKRKSLVSKLKNPN